MVGRAQSWKNQIHTPRVGERAHRPQGWVVSGQRTTTEEAQPHPSADNWIKVLLSKALPTRARLSFPYHQSLPPGSLHKPPSLLIQMADRRTTIPQWLKQKLHFGKTMGKTQEMFTKELKGQRWIIHEKESDLEDRMWEIPCCKTEHRKKNGKKKWRQPKRPLLLLSRFSRVRLCVIPQTRPLGQH